MSPKNKFAPETFCILPFNSLSISSSGAIRACCDVEELAKDAAGKEYGFKNHSPNIDEVFNSKYHKDLRLALINGKKHSQCHRCWDVEKNGGCSNRQTWTDRFSGSIDAIMERLGPDGSLPDPQFRHVEFTLGNLCNFKCRMCSPFNSSAWLKEFEAHKMLDSDQLEPLKKIDWYKRDHFKEFTKKIFEHTEFINFIGGEPFLIKEHLDYLKYCVEKGWAAKIELKYNTNLSRIPEEAIELWREFRCVNISVSCDGVGDLYEYIRFPGKWEVFCSNLSRIEKLSSTIRLELEVAVTLQVLNATRMHELLKWIYEKTEGTNICRIPYVNYVNAPTWLDPKILPLRMRKLAYDRQMEFIASVKAEKEREKILLQVLESQLKHMMSEPDSVATLRSWGEFKHRNTQMDRYRGQSLERVAPDLYKLFGSNSMT